tara:strand:+ start:1182 stop:1376 length:195 start_codon:yes stop_codon:yes gene_type:complete
MKQRIKYKNKYMAFRISLVEQMLKDNLPVKVMASIFNTTEQNIYYDFRRIANSKYEDRRKMNNG